MTAFLQDTDGDLALTKNRMRMTDGRIETAQTLRSRLRVFEGEWFLDETAGTPYFQEVLGKSKNPRSAEAAIKAVIVGTPNVTGLLEFSFTLNKQTREASVAFKVSSPFGPIELSEVLQ